MPPRSTNAPKSAMFLTTPLRIWPSLIVGEQVAPSRVSRSSSMSLRREMTMFMRASSILMMRASISLPMNSPMSPVRRIVDLATPGRNTGTPMSTSRPPLILRRHAPLTTSPSLVRRDDALPAADAVGLALRELGEPARGPAVLEEDLDLLADHRDAFAELGDRQGALGLGAEVDEDLFLPHLDDAALDDAARLDRALGRDVELALEVRDLLELFCELPLDVVLGGRETFDELA